MMDSEKLSIFFVAGKNKSFQRTLVRRNDLFFSRLEYEVFYKSILNFNFLRAYQ